MSPERALQNHSERSERGDSGVLNLIVPLRRSPAGAAFIQEFTRE